MSSVCLNLSAFCFLSFIWAWRSAVGQRYIAWVLQHLWTKFICRIIDNLYLLRRSKWKIRAHLKRELVIFYSFLCTNLFASAGNQFLFDYCLYKILWMTKAIAQEWVEGSKYLQLYTCCCLLAALWSLLPMKKMIILLIHCFSSTNG